MVLDELINYTRKGNFDSTLALMGAMIQLEDKFNIHGDVLINEEYYNKIDKQMVSYINDKMSPYYD